jgi:hypothetical protein
MVKSAHPDDNSEPPESGQHGRSVIQVANNLFFIIVFLAIALGALAFGLTR